MLHGLQHNYDFITDDMTASAIALAGGGAGSHTGSCGAFSGGLMALSACFCPHSENLSEEELTRLEKASPRFTEFRDWFIKEFGGVNCSDALQKLFGFCYKLNNDEERAALRNIQKRLGFSCDLIVEKAAVKAAEIIARDS